MIFAIFYQFCLIFLSLFMLPKLFYQWLFLKKYRNSLSHRFGCHFPIINKGKKKIIWIHAVSVGETKAVASLAKQLKNSHPDYLLLISSISETGHAEAKRSLPFADYHVYMPLDYFWVIDPIVKKIKPDLVILTEGDFWMQFIRSCKQTGAYIAVVNGKMSDRSTKRHLLFPLFARTLFVYIDLFCIQNIAYKNNFERLGVASEKTIVTGNMKFDENYPQLKGEELASWKKQLGLQPDEFMIVVGSTHDSEEALVIDMAKKIWEKYPAIKLAIIPRHPERFEEVATLLSKNNMPFSRYSKQQAGDRILLVDAMGVLRKCYQTAFLAVVGGSFTNKVGGHNIIEPCFYGVPVLFGPHMYTQKELVSLVSHYQSGLQIGAEQLAETVISLIEDTEKMSRLGQGGKRMVEEMQGATERTLRAIKFS